MRKLLFLLLLCPFIAEGQGWLWARVSVGTEAQGANSVAADRVGNVYMTGYSDKNYDTDTGNSIAFGSLGIASTAFAYNYLVKYDTSGSPVWLKKIPFSNSTYVATDGAGNVFLAGSYTGSFTLGTFTLAAADTIATNVYVAKQDASGAVLWLASGTGAGATGGTASALTADSAGNVFVAGIISHSITFGVHVLDSNDLFLVKYDTGGNLVWANTLGGHPHYDSVNSGVIFPEHINSMAADAGGNVIAGGWYTSDTFTAGDRRLVNLSAGGFNGFVVKYDTAGYLSWANTVGGSVSVTGPEDDYLNAVTTDAAGNVYAGGVTNADVLHIGSTTYANTCSCYTQLLAKYSAAGDFEWFHSAVFPGGSPATNGSFVTGLTSGNGHSIYMMGITTDQANFGAVTLPACNYLVEMDTAGNYTSAAVVADLSLSLPQAIAADTNGNAYIAGSYFADCTEGIYPLTLTGATNAFLLKYGPGGAATTVVQQDVSHINLDVFPNPVTSMLNIAASEKIALVEVSNMYGQRVYSVAPGDRTMSIDFSGYAAGVYLVKINGVEVRKVVKE